MKVKTSDFISLTGPCLTEPTQTTTSDSTKVGAVIAFLILLGSVIAFITYVKTF